MYQIGDDSELDRLSREASDKYTPPGKPDWDALREELDIVLPVKEKRRRTLLIFWWVWPLLLATGGFIYWYSHYTTPIQQDKTTTATQVSPIPENKTLQTGKSAHAITSGSTNPGATPLQTDVFEKNRSRQDLSKKSVMTITKKTPLSFEHTDGKPGKVSSHENIVIPDQGNTIAAGNTSVSAWGKTDNTVIHPGNNPIQVITDSQKNEIKEPLIMTPTPETGNRENKKNDSHTVITSSGKGFSYSLLAGVDKSTVKYTHGDHPGYNLGIEIGYHFNHRWSIQTGAIYTQKKYTVNGSDFTPPKGSWASNYQFDEIEGYCRMWEVPLLVRYQLGTGRKPSPISFSTGLSSYFMTKENYTYYYLYNGQPVIRNTNYASSDTHLLSIWHISAAYSSPVSKKWILGIEPYAKLPLGGVGFGQIRLSSFGINLFLQHRQPSKK